jgi:AraC-like DNA-binding protein
VGPPHRGTATARRAPAAARRACALRLDRGSRDAHRRAHARGAAVTVADAAAKAYISERELQRRFVHDVGYAPKTLQRVLRFQRFMGQLALPRVELAGAAARAGYADQSHLSREARRLSGLSPRQLVGYQH